jgi:hypothetical protein
VLEEGNKMPAADYPHATDHVTTAATFLFTMAPTLAHGVVKNRGPETVYIGGSTVTADETSTGGYPLEPGEQMTIPSCDSSNNSGLNLYAITEQNSAYVSWIAV